MNTLEDQLVINVKRALIRQLVTLRFMARNNPGEAPFQTTDSAVSNSSSPPCTPQAISDEI